MKMDIKEIRELLKLVDKFDVQDFTLQEGDTRIRIRKGGVLQEPVDLRSRETAVVEPPARPAPAPAVEAAPAADDTLTVGENPLPT
jgi:acetyl-CoA carboxylase biotin carboxyl carrier protein